MTSGWLTHLTSVLAINVLGLSSPHWASAVSARIFLIFLNLVAQLNKANGDENMLRLLTADVHPT